MSLSRIVPPSLVLLGTLTACGGGESPLETFESRVGYAIGLDIGTNLEGAGVEIDLDALARGLRDGMSGAEPLLSPAEGMEVLQEFQLRAEQEMTRRAEEGLRANREEGEAYLAENGAREGVITTESGLQYRFVTRGEGPIPDLSDRVTVHYRGTFIDGETFDSSYDRGTPATFGVTQVIPGWTEALQLIPVGSTVELAIPGAIAYGVNAPPEIGPDRTLLFELELLSIDSIDP